MKCYSASELLEISERLELAEPVAELARPLTVESKVPADELEFELSPHPV